MWARPDHPLAALGQHVDGLPGNGPALDSRHGTGKDPGMTPEERFFPTCGDDELWVHHDALERRDETPPDAICHARGVPEGQNIGQGPEPVPGKKSLSSLAGEPRASWSFHLPHGLLAVLCALLIHGLVLAGIGMWLGLGGGTGPVLMALELSSAADGLAGAGLGAGKRAAGSFASGESSLLPLLAPNISPSFEPADQKTVPLSSPSTSSPSVRSERSIPSSTPVQTRVKPARPAPVRINAARIESLFEPSLAGPAENGAYEAAAADTAPSGQDQIKDPSSRHGGKGEGGTSAEESGAGGTGARAIGLDAGDGSGDGKSAGGGALLDFGVPGGPEIVRMVWPVYPYEARRLGKEGLVILKLSLEASGEVEAVEILQPAGFGMDEAARKAVQQSRFRPATRGGRPVGCQAVLPVRFTLR